MYYEKSSSKMLLQHDSEHDILEKAWENIGIADDFMFGKLMQSPDLCKKLFWTLWQEKQ